MSLLKTTCKAADKIRIMSGRMAWRDSVEQSVCDCVTLHSITSTAHCVCGCERVCSSHKCSRCHSKAVSLLWPSSAEKSNITFKLLWTLKFMKRKAKNTLQSMSLFFKAWTTEKNCKAIVELFFVVPGSCGRGSRRGSDPECSSVPAHSSPGPRYWRPPPGQRPERLSPTFSHVSLQWTV